MKTMIVCLLLVGGPALADTKSACFDNLCGDAMYGEQYCSCHKGADGNRCWSQQADCEVDAACCAGAKCGAISAEDKCAQKTSAERKKRDAKRKAK